MKKKILIAAMLAALAAVPVFAATADQAQSNDWFNQMFNNHKQMVQQAVDNGTITADQAAQMNEHMQQMAPVMQKMMQNGGMMNGGMMGNSGMNQTCGTGNVNNNNK
ncbi:hypothetical protein SRRS_05550 [Sporomusa rhizae]|uniref:DUF2680 domain-containing protein n=1 Tax=Sporomusa rhizae TaxID=357999 RepID=UPI00352AC26D